MMSQFVFLLLIVLAVAVGHASAFLLPLSRTLTNIHRRPGAVVPTLSKFKHKPKLSTIRYYKPLDSGTSYDTMKSSFPAEVEAQPSKRVIQLEYNYLSTSSIFTIRHKWQPAHTALAGAIARGEVKEDRPGDSFLINWWHKAKKWGVLKGHLLGLEVTERDRLACAASTARASSVANTAAVGRSARTDRDDTRLTSSSAVASAPVTTTSTFDQDLLYLKGVLERPNAGDALGRNTERRMNESMARLLHKHQDALKVRIGDEVFEKYEKMYGKYDQDALHSNNDTTGVDHTSNLIEETSVEANATEPEDQGGRKTGRIADFLSALRAGGHETAITKSVIVSRILTLAVMDHRPKGTTSEGAEKGEAEGGASKVDEEVVPLEALHQLCRHHTARVIAIGDVHGCANEVRNLLRKIVFMPGDQILFLGETVHHTSPFPLPH